MIASVKARVREKLPARLFRCPLRRGQAMLRSAKLLIREECIHGVRVPVSPPGPALDLRLPRE